MVHAQTRTRTGEWDAQTDHLIPARRPDRVIVKKKRESERERTCRIVDFAVSANLRVKIKGNEKWDKYLTLGRELKIDVEQESNGDANCNWCAWKGPQKLRKRWLEELEIGGRIESIQITAFFRSFRILRRVLETWRDLLSLSYKWKTIS